MRGPFVVADPKRVKAFVADATPKPARVFVATTMRPSEIVNEFGSGDWRTVACDALLQKIFSAKSKTYGAISDAIGSGVMPEVVLNDPSVTRAAEEEEKYLQALVALDHTATSSDRLAFARAWWDYDGGHDFAAAAVIGNRFLQAMGSTTVIAFARETQSLHALWGDKRNTTPEKLAEDGAAQVRKKRGSGLGARLRTAIGAVIGSE